VTTLELDTPFGPARAYLRLAVAPSAALVLGHGAGGGVSAPDLVAAADAAIEAAVSVVLVEQPYRVAGRRSPAPAHQLDAAWTAVIDQLAARELEGLPLVTGGRSSGARVACRTAVTTRAVGVLCLAFPLQPPQRAGAASAPSRLAELDAVPVPTLVVQGEGDRFGLPPASERRTVVVVSGDHSLRRDAGRIGESVRAWLDSILADAGSSV
jgi:uncharacterized protein